MSNAICLISFSSLKNQKSKITFSKSKITIPRLIFIYHVLSRALVILVCLVLYNIACATERVALVIGNSDYQNAPLLNPINDANAMAKLLVKAGFKVEKHLDTDLKSLRSAIDQFGTSMQDPNVKFGFFYYAGHGIQQNWHNFLVPVDANIKETEEVPAKTFDINGLLRHLNRAKGKNFLIILDACRDDPFGISFKPQAKGLSQFDAPAGSLLAYATAPGSVAQDGEGANGLYTGFILREFAVSGVRLEDAFKRVRLGVRLASNGAQIPWESTSLEDDIYLFPIQSIKLTEAQRDQLLDREMDAWRKVQASSDLETLANFIREFPSGSASELAQFKLNRLFAAIDSHDERRMQNRWLGQNQSSDSKSSAIDKPQTDVLAVQHAPFADVALRPEAITQKPGLAASSVASNHENTPIGSVELIPSPVNKMKAAAVSSTAALTSQTKATPPNKTKAPVVLPAFQVAPTPNYKGFNEHLRSYAVGDVHTYQVIDRYTKISKPLVMTVTKVDPALQHVEYNQGEFASDLMGNTTRTQRGSLSTPRQFYPAELFIGKKWNTRFKQSRPSGITYTYQYDLKVVARELVTVPAGTFECYKIEARGFNIELGASLERNIWVSPGLSADVAHEIVVRLRSGKVEQNDRQELVAYSSQKP